VALTAALGDLHEDEFLVFSVKSRDYFVQFASQGAFGMRAEATSNTFIDEYEDRLSMMSQIDMRRLGWNEPTYAPSEGSIIYSDGSCNYYLNAAPPVPYVTLAALTVDTFREVYGLRYPSELVYAAYAEDGVSIRFPLLGIQRQEHKTSEV
jgi:hypothetical protein